MAAVKPFPPAGIPCAAHPEVRVLFISGGGEVGAIYAEQARAFDKLFFAGPSGLPPALVFKDAPLERTAQFLVRRAFINGGQYCTCPKRAYIQRDIYDRLRNLIVAQMSEIKVGAPEDPATWIGPLRVARTRTLLDRALEALKEPRFLVPCRREGQWQGPFLVETPEPPDVELFGPLLALVPVNTEEDAVAQVLKSRLINGWKPGSPTVKVIRRNMTELVDLLASNADLLPCQAAERISVRRLTERESERTAKDIMEPLPVVRVDTPLTQVAALIVQGRGNIIAVMGADERIAGVVTTWDITRAVAEGTFDGRLEAIMTKRVVSPGGAR